MRISIRRFIAATLSAVAMMAGPGSLPAMADEAKPVDLAVSQTDSPDPTLENGFVTYAVAVSNVGPQPANGVIVTGSINGGRYVSGTGHRWTCALSGTTASCDHNGAIEKGKPADTLRLVVQAPTHGTVSQLVHSVSVSTLSPDYSDTNLLNNSSTETTGITPGSDVTLAQTDEPDPVAAGNTVRYIISATNNSNSLAATGVTLNTSASSGSVSEVSGEGWTCTISATDAGKATCSLSTAIGPNGHAPDVYLQVLTPFSTTASTMTNQATISSATADTNQANNTKVETTTVGTGSGYRVTASGYIDPDGGQVSTCAPGATTPTDTTCTTAVFPAGPGGIATLVESEPLDICATAGCTGDAVDVIVPDGYNFGSHSAIQVYLYVDGTISDPADDLGREIYVEKPGPTGEKTEAVAIPSCTARIPGLPCVSSQERLANGDYLAIVELFSQDPLLEVGDGPTL